MASLGSILEIAKTGLMTQQKAMNVTAHNIANASTEGYSRQRALLEGNPSLRLPEGVYGTGVRIDDVQRIADPLLEASVYRESAIASGFGTRAGLLGRVESLLGEPSEFGLGAAIDGFHSAWSELATAPTASVVRVAVRQSAAHLTSKFHELAGGVDAFRQEVETKMEASVDSVNSMLRQIGDLTGQIVSDESGGATSGDLRDARGRLLTQLSQVLPIQVHERVGGGLMVTSSGVGIVDGVSSATLEMRQTGGVWSLGTTAGSTLRPTAGSLSGLMEVANIDIPAIRQGLDDLAEAIVTAVNTTHVTGTNPAGTTGISFFDPAGTSASAIELSADVLASLDAIAAGTPDGLGMYRGGANDVAVAIAGLRDTDVPALGMTIGERFGGLVFDIGQGVRSSTDAAEVHRTLADQANVRRMELSGVSVDEELVRMIEFQTAYQASARVVTAADEMLQALLTM